MTPGSPDAPPTTRTPRCHHPRQPQPRPDTRRRSPRPTRRSRSTTVEHHGRHADFETRKGITPLLSQTAASRQPGRTPRQSQPKRQAVHEPTRPTTYRTLRPLSHTDRSPHTSRRFRQCCDDPLNLRSPPGHGPDNQSMARPRAQQLQDQLPGLLEKVQQRGPRLYSESVSRVVIIVSFDTHNRRSQAIVEYQNRARGGTRTHMPVRAARFKRAASTSCATRALLPRYRHRAAGIVRYAAAASVRAGAAGTAVAGSVLAAGSPPSASPSTASHRAERARSARAPAR